jgi:hypothetical protein
MTDAPDTEKKTDRIGLTRREWTELPARWRTVYKECKDCENYFGLRDYAFHVVENHGYDPRIPKDSIVK